MKPKTEQAGSAYRAHLFLQRCGHPFCGAAAFAVQGKEQRPPQEASQKIGRINSYRYPADRRNSTQKKMVTTLMREEKITPLAERVSSAPNSRAIT